MISLADLFNGKPLMEDFKSLSDPNLDFAKDREIANRLVMNFIIKYLAAYLEIPEMKSVRALAQEIKMVTEFTVLCAMGDFAEGGDVDIESQGGDNYAVRCLYDIRQTAAIFKEIVFSNAFEKTKTFFGLDLGSGTGILAVAMVLAARRKGIREIRSVGIERSFVAVERATKVAERLGLSKEIEFMCEDLLTPGLIEGLVSDRPLSFWVSETISIAVPKFDPTIPGFDLNMKLARGRKTELRSDPFVEVLKKTIDADPKFLENVRTCKVAMFPDMANGLYTPDGNRSKIDLKTGLGNPLPLERLGQEFEAYEDLGSKHRRWANEKDYN
jgi:hypothetical protein